MYMLIMPVTHLFENDLGSVLKLRWHNILNFELFADTPFHLIHSMKVHFFKFSSGGGLPSRF